MEGGGRLPPQVIKKKKAYRKRIEKKDKGHKKKTFLRQKINKRMKGVRDRKERVEQKKIPHETMT